MNKLRIITGHCSVFRVILIGFSLVILAGSYLLCLPIASAQGTWTSYIDALFTSTSAVCVTGLIVHDTATYWSLFGKIVILILIQIGGLGVVTVAAVIAILSGQKIGLMQRSLMQSSISAPGIGGIVRMTKFIVKGTILIELLGAAIMAPVFIGDFGIIKGIGYAIFHSISAFCNAGFDLMGVRSPYSSLTTYVDNPVINLTVVALIIIGGLGFLSWTDLLKNRFHLKDLHLQTKVILTMTFFLILLPFLYFYFVEYTEVTCGQRILMSLFQSVTPRTAGFNTADYSHMSDTGILITIGLMLIGGAPGSTAGGMKVTTFCVVLLSVNAALRQKKTVSICKRRFTGETIHDAFTLASTYLFLLLLGAAMISSMEGMPVLRTMFECASALGTVGLTTGITPLLHMSSKLILILFMFFGRVGVLTLAYATVRRKEVRKGILPEEKVMVG